LRRYLFLLLLPLLLAGTQIHLTLHSVTEDAQSATALSQKVHPGVSGFIIRHFNKEHSAIIANAVVTSYDDTQGLATLQLSPYTGLRQNSLPTGTWQAKPDDEVVLAYGYNRALLLTPNEHIWHKITSRTPIVEWIHPDN